MIQPIVTRQAAERGGTMKSGMTTAPFRNEIAADGDAPGYR